MISLDAVRAKLPPAFRERAYNYVGATVVVLGAWGLADQNKAATIAQLVLAAVTLGFAVLYSTNTLRAALYGVLAAAQPVAALWAFGSADKWAAVLAMAAAVLGTQTASGRTPAAYDSPARHAALTGDSFGVVRGGYRG